MSGSLAGWILALTPAVAWFAVMLALSFAPVRLDEKCPDGRHEHPEQAVRERPNDDECGTP